MSVVPMQIQGPRFDPELRVPSVWGFARRVQMGPPTF